IEPLDRLRERDEADDGLEPELVDELLRLQLVVLGEVERLQRAADERREEALAADGAADDQKRRVDAAVADLRRRLEELAEALLGVDEAEVRDDRPLERKAELGARVAGVAGAEVREVDRVRDDGRADAEDGGDVSVD